MTPINIPSTSAKHNNSENENLQLQINHEKYPSELKNTEVKYELLTKNGKIFFTHINLLIPFYPKKNFCLIESYNEQSPVTTHDFDRSDIIQTDLYISYDNSVFDDYDDDPFCDNCEDTKIMFDNNQYKSVKIDDDYHHPS